MRHEGREFSTGASTPLRPGFGGAAAESGCEGDEERKAHDAHRDPDPRNHEREDDADHDQRDGKADHGRLAPERLEINHHEALFGQLAHGVRGPLTRVARVLDAAVGHLVGAA